MYNNIQFDKASGTAVRSLPMISRVGSGQYSARTDRAALLEADLSGPGRYIQIVEDPVVTTGKVRYVNMLVDFKAREINEILPGRGLITIGGVTTDREGEAHAVLKEVDVPAYFKDLFDLISYDDNWDGHGSPKPSRAAIQSARVALAHWSNRDVEPQVAPLSDGGVTIEIETDDLSGAIDFYPDGRVAYYFNRNGQEYANRLHVDNDLDWPEALQAALALE